METEKDTELPQNMRTTGEAELVFNGQVIWCNPASLGHFGIKCRKQTYENWLADQISAGVSPEERARLWEEILNYAAQVK